MKIIENKTNFPAEKLFAIAKRENNEKRRHLLVNFLQAKHLPVQPEITLQLFSQLGNLLAQTYREKNVLIIGFAETATAIGAAVAQCFGASAHYLHTSRENILDAARIVDFNEEHSHATEQVLFCHNWEKICDNVDCILFIEDEITTGKTILNFIAALREKNAVLRSVKFVAASIINGMHAENARIYADQEIDYHYLLKLQCDDFTPFISNIPVIEAAAPILVEESLALPVISVSGRADPRTGLSVKTYEAAIKQLAATVMRSANLKTPAKQSILVLGTEEFMYPAIKTAQSIAKTMDHLAVFVHATTRSPILPFDGRADYPIRRRSSLRSVYDIARKTYIYNLRSYDKVIVITDALGCSVAGFADLTQALRESGCSDIILVKWVN